MYRSDVVRWILLSITLLLLSGAPGESATQPKYAIAGKAINCDVDQTTGSLTITDARTGKIWAQHYPQPSLSITSFRKTGPRSDVLGISIPGFPDIVETVTVDRLKPEVTVVLTADGPMVADLRYPSSFCSSPGDSLVIPLNEGILYPVDDESVGSMRLVAYGGHGISMPWYGLVNNADGSGILTLIQTPDDASIEMGRPQGLLCVQPVWESTRHTFGYSRVIRYVVFDKGGYVAQAKYYRSFAKESGLFVSLAEKRKSNPNIDRLVGAANVWTWDPKPDRIGFCKELKGLGFDHVLWSNSGTPTELAQINSLGYLTSEYDNYQDVYPPGAPTQINEAAWPSELVVDDGGTPVQGWVDKQKHADGTETDYTAGVVCSSYQLTLAMDNMPKRLDHHPFNCRFLDTVTASAFRECYSPVHPLTRGQDKRNKMALLAYFSRTLKLVTGTETGIDPSVPYADYYEGMMSLAPYRLPDAGRDITDYKVPTPDFLKYQVGYGYRIPLWELVYHECTVSYWYWGDASNKDPEVWDQRDLFNVLYGTPPLYAFTSDQWKSNLQRFTKSYRTVGPVARELGYTELLSHSFLTADHSVQQTVWADGTVTTVNFGAAPFILGHETVQPGSFVINKQ